MKFLSVRMILGTAMLLLNCASPVFGADGRLFNSQAFRSADRESSNGKARTISSKGASIGERVRVETADDILLRTDYQKKFLNSYRGVIYLTSHSEIFDSKTLSDWETEDSVAEKLLIYQLTKSFSDWIQGSPLDLYYRQTIRDLTAVRDATTVQLSRSDQGSVAVGNTVKPSDELLKFQFHASVNSGIEPRFYYNKNIIFRYNVLDSKALLEYNFDF